MISRCADFLHGAVQKRIDPTFDILENITFQYLKLYPPIVLGLTLAFPIWIATGQILNSLREK